MLKKQLKVGGANFESIHKSLKFKQVWCVCYYRFEIHPPNPSIQIQPKTIYNFLVW